MINLSFEPGDFIIIPNKPKKNVDESYSFLILRKHIITFKPNCEREALVYFTVKYINGCKHLDIEIGEIKSHTFSLKTCEACIENKKWIVHRLRKNKKCE